MAESDVYNQLRTQEQSGSWSEGVKPKPVAGSTVELIFVLTDYQEPVSSGGFPASAKLQFYLDGPHDVFLIVRELDYQTDYWLDHVHPARPWRKGYRNIFAWPTGPVLQQLAPKLEVYDLGALIRLNTEAASSVEWVAPGVLYHHSPSSMIDG